MISTATFLAWSIFAAVLMLLAALGLVLIRLVKGPTLADRVVALDMIAYVAVALIATLTLARSEPALLDGAMALALMAFLATVAFARYVQSRGSEEKPDP